MVSTPSGIVISVIPQLPKAVLPIFLSPDGRTTSASAVQPLNALSPISVTVSGRVTFVMLSICAKAHGPITVTVLPSSVSGTSTSLPEPVHFVIVTVEPSSFTVKL